MFINENINWNLKRLKNGLKKVKNVSLLNFIDENDEDLQKSIQEYKSERKNFSFSDQL